MMKDSTKWFCSLVVSLIISIIGCLLLNEAIKDSENQETPTVSQGIEMFVDKYSYQSVYGADLVVDFLNNLDEEMFEVIDITQNNSLYTIFYKSIE